MAEVHPHGMSIDPGVIAQWPNPRRDGKRPDKRFALLSNPQTARRNLGGTAILARPGTCPHLSGIPVHTIDLRW
jgi:hypothetical protein